MNNIAKRQSMTGLQQEEIVRTTFFRRIYKVGRIFDHLSYTVLKKVLPPPQKKNDANERLTQNLLNKLPYLIGG